MRLFISSLLTFAFIATGFAQELPMTLEFKNLYRDNVTRGSDGKPTGNYWQNTAKYDIQVKIEPEDKLLKGKAVITYFNNSPYTLQNLVLHAYHNLYKPDSKRAQVYPVTKGMIIDRLSTGGKEVDLDNEDAFQSGSTFNVWRTTKPLTTGDSITFEVDWHYTIPGNGFERSGAIDPTSMFIGYWYPEVAVFDDVHGWDAITYDGSAEFYHDVADFKVAVEVPSDYVVWASSPLLNAREVLPRKLFKRYEEARDASESITIVGREDLDEGLEMKSNVWKFEAKGFPDFAFALSNDFIWEASSYQDETGHYFLHIAYDSVHPAFASVLPGQKASLEIFHNQFPKRPFPYKHFTIFNGLAGGGMEFPGIANDEAYSGEQWSQWIGKEVSDLDANLVVTLHEMFHMYFPFQMGINEKRYAWMDEGWASFAEYFIPNPIYQQTWDSPGIAGHNISPMMVPTYTQPGVSGTNSYTMGAYSYYSLYMLLGEETFDRCMAAYMERWSGKHPTPYDFFFTFNEVSGQDLNWFWKRWYFDFAYPDLAIESFENGILTIQNEGGRPLGFQVEYTLSGGETRKENFSPVIWKDGHTQNVTVGNAADVARIKLLFIGGSDALYSNNLWLKEEE